MAHSPRAGSGGLGKGGVEGLGLGDVVVCCLR